VSDREQPGKRATSVRSKARKRRKRCREGLSRQIGRELAVACASQEEREDSVYPPAIKEPKRLRLTSARDEQRLVSPIIIDAHNDYIVNPNNL
jgi:hypothetical protein